MNEAGCEEALCDQVSHHYGEFLLKVYDDTRSVGTQIRNDTGI